MTRFFPNLELALKPIWVVLILVVASLALFLKYRKRLGAFISRTLSAIKDFRDSLSITSDSDYTQVLYKFIQGLHSNAEYFPLDSILIPSKCIAPPPYLSPGNDSLDTSLIQQSIGYDPLLPHLNSDFFGPTFPLIDAIQTGTNLCLVGFPGTGKTIAIAECIAGLLNPPEPDPEEEEELPQPRIPFYAKAHHVLAQFPNRDLLGVLLKALQLNKSFQVIPNFPKYLTSALKSGEAILFIDDMDGLPLEDINRLANFISALHAQYPFLQVVATASPSCLGNLIKAPVEFLSLSPWGDQDKYLFLEKLSTLWSSMQPSESEEGTQNYDVLSSMLVASGRNLTPLEFSSNAIAAFGGVLTGPTSSQAMDAYFQRIGTLSKSAENTLELMAVFCLDKESASFSRKELNHWVSTVYQKNNRNPDAISPGSFQAVIQIGLDQNILLPSSDSRYHFQHPTAAGYLAARGLAKSDRSMIQAILDSHAWGPLSECMKFFAQYNDIKPFLKPLLMDQSLLRDKLLRAASWLSDTKHKSPEEVALLKQIAREIHSNPIYLVKLRLVGALTRSNNPQINAILKHLQNSKDLDTRRAAAVGLGLLKDLSAVPNLIKQLNDPFPSSTAACYALGKIGSPRSLEAIAEALLHGNELLRRAAAESLAQNRSEGHPALREGATMDDLLVRYAVVHGLSSIAEPWAVEILDEMRIEEKEWVVRDLAQQAHEILTTQSPYLPHAAPPAHEAPWLSAFASRQSLSPPTAENALDLLLNALSSGSAEQKQNALAYLSRNATKELMPLLLDLTRAKTPDLSHQAALSIWLSGSQLQHTNS